MMKEIFKEWRIWMLITALLGAAVAIGPHYGLGEDGNTVIKHNIQKGLDIEGGARVMVKPNMTGVPVEERSATIDQIITTLKTRVQAFGLQDMTIRSVSSLNSNNQFIQVEMAGASIEELKDLISSQGMFRAYLTMRAQEGDTVSLGGSDFTVESGNNSVIIGETEIKANRTGTVEGDDYSVEVILENITEDGYNLGLVAFTGQDVTGVDINPSRSGVGRESGGNYPFQFQVSIRRESAERFKDIAGNFPPQNNQQYLPGTKLVLTLDDSQVSSLNVASVFANQAITEPSISGGEPTREEAVKEMNTLKSVLQSGALPVPIDIVSTNSVSPVLGEQFMSTALIALFSAVIGVGVLIFIRYSNPKVAIPIIITGFSEVFILLGVFSDASYLFNSGGGLALLGAAVGIPTLIGITTGIKKSDFSCLMLPFISLFIVGIMRFSTSLDLAAIAGIISAVGTGVDDQIIITDERTREKVRTLKKKVKRAFFIIFTSAASTIGAMIPVMSIGAGAVKGFAITTILGVLIGITITRPAYAKVLDKLEVK